MAAAHHAAQRPAYSLPPHPSSNSFPPDDLRLPSIKDLQFHYPPRRQDHPQSSEPPPGYEHNHPQPPERAVRHPQYWPRPHPPHHTTSHTPQGPPQPPPPSNPVHPPQHQQQPPQNHEPPSKPPDYHHRHENNVYATPGLPLSAQTAPVPGSVNSGPAVRNEDHHQHISHKRARTGDRTPVVSLRDTRPASTPYHYAPSYQATSMPPPSPYNQSGTSSVVPPSPVHPTHSTPSPHQVQNHPPLPPQQTYTSYHHAQYSQPPPPPPPRSTNVPHPIPVSAPPPPSVQTPTTPLPPTPTSAPAQATHVLSYTQSAPSSASQEWETPPPPQAPPPLQHFPHYPLSAGHQQPPPPSSPAPSTPSTHHVQQQHHSHHPHPPPPVPPVHSQPPPQTAHLVYPQQAQTAPQAQAPAPAPAQPYTKTTSVNPTDLDTRGAYSTVSHNTAPAPSGGSSPDSTMSELVSLCSILYDFASRYAQLNGSVPGPTPHEIVEMASRANEVVRLLEELRRSNATEGQRIVKNDNMVSAEDHRPPKRPWEDMAEEGQVSPDDYQQQEVSASYTTLCWRLRSTFV
ncbi:hypothetical protein L218DRAFT_656378 [Marasmius fiardii PR-910]|nr:hypothetical protein L218DRAFT_656378 [Marasmius fiardii PR-910]